MGTSAMHGLDITVSGTSKPGFKFWLHKLVISCEVITDFSVPYLHQLFFKGA